MLVIKFESPLLYHELRKHFHLFFIYKYTCIIFYIQTISEIKLQITS